MITSHECTEDYEYFYRSLSHITSLSIPLSICYVVQDASLSEYQGLKNVFPEACVLMCYFHVTSNVIKNYCKYNVQLVKRKQINTEIYYYKIEVSGLGAHQYNLTTGLTLIILFRIFIEGFEIKCSLTLH